MSFADWSRRTSTPTASGGFGGMGGWGAAPQPTQEQQKDQALFASLFPVGGLVSGEQVKPVFSASRLSQSKLAQIWNMVDLDHDGKINVSEFCTAMHLIRQAQQQEGGLLGSSQGVGFFQQGMAARQPSASLGPRQQSSGLFGTSPSSDVSKSWPLPSAVPLQTPSPLSSSPLGSSPSSTAHSMGGVGRSVSMNVITEGWAMKPQDKRRYLMEFNTHDRNKSGYLAGADVRPILTKFQLDHSTLAQIWDLSDMDKDGRLSADEFAIAMHLIEKAKSGLVLPKTLPAELKSSPAKFNTVERLRRGSEDTIEDKRKENFEIGRMELERRRRARQEQLERENAEKERRRRAEEEQRLQQEREAEIARQAELERQRRKALEIERERERQMQKLAMQREQEQREMERRRKEEWARRRQLELEGQREWERKSLQSMQAQDSELEEELRQLDQKKLALFSRVDRQKTLCAELNKTLHSLRLSSELRRAELSKLQTELNGFQLQLISLQQQQQQLQEALQARSPKTASFQQQRQQLRDGIVGLAASLAGLRSTLTSNTEDYSTQQAKLQKQRKTLEEVRSSIQPEEVRVRDLRLLVGMRKKAWEDHQKKVKEDDERRKAEERQQQEEQEHLQRMKEKAMKEARVERIRREQEEALRKERERKASEEVEAALKESSSVLKIAKELAQAIPSPVSVVGEKVRREEEGRRGEEGRRSEETWMVREEPSITKQPPQPSKREVREKDKELVQKVKELQKRKAQLQKQRHSSKEEIPESPSSPKKKKPPPSRPAPYGSRSKPPVKEREKAKDKQKKTQEDSKSTPPLLDLMSSWDTSAQRPGINAFNMETSEILQPLRVPEETQGPATVEVEETTSTVAETEPSQRLASLRQVFEEALSSQENSSAEPLYSIVQKGPRWRQLQSTVAAQPEEQTVEAQPEEQTVESQPEEQAVEAQPEEQAVVQSTAAPVQYRALYDFNASDSTELSFREGDVLTVCPDSDVSPGWLVAEIGGENGWVPESYLELMDGEKKEEGGEEVWREEEEESVKNVKVEEVKTEQPRAPQDSPPPLRAQVIFSWKGSKANHLPIQRGEIVSVLQRSEKWWSGEFDGKVGWFPKTFVRLLPEEKEEASPMPSTSEALPRATLATESLLPQPVKEQLPSSPPPPSGEGGSTETVMYEAVYDYEGQAEGDLSFLTGNIIQVVKQEGEWWTGVLNGVEGVFPSNYVQRTKSSSVDYTAGLQTISSDVIIHTKPVIARVTIAFQPDREGQLSLQIGEYIRVRKQAGNGWWEGELQSRGKQRRAGWFPANRVRLLSRLHSTGDVNRAKSPLVDVLEPQSKPSSQNMVLALYSYPAQSSDELSFHKGSVLTVLSKEEGEWWKGELNGQVGLFPCNYVQPLMEQAASTETRWADSVSPDVLAAVSDQERKRQEAIFELLSSERNYVDSLKLVMEVFFDPLVESEVLSEEELSKVRVNWEELLQSNSELLNAFLVRLRTSGAVVRNIGDILLNQIPNLHPHIRWCSCQLTACTILQQKASDPQFKEFERKCAQDPRTGGLPLSSFLLKPMQRVTKYPLLIKRILDYTSEKYADYEELKSSLEQLEMLCTRVNEAVRSKENTEQLEWLQTHIQFTLDEHLVFNSQTNFMGSRKLLHWGKLFKIRGGKDLVGFLFNDFFLLVKPKLFFHRAVTPSELEPFGKNEFQMYRKPFLFDGMRVKMGPPDQFGPSVFLLLHQSEEKPIPLRAESDSIRDKWMKKIAHACMEYMQIKKKQERERKQKYIQTLKGSVGRLKVTVVEAADLQAKDLNGKSDPFCVVRLGEMQEQTTDVLPSTLNPKWNYKMEFAVYDLNKDAVEISVFDKDLFSPNDFLGSTKQTLKDLLSSGDSPWTKRLLLEDVKKGEIELRFELELNKSDLLL